MWISKSSGTKEFIVLQHITGMKMKKGAKGEKLIN